MSETNKVSISRHVYCIGALDDIQTALKLKTIRKKCTTFFKIILGLGESFKTMKQPEPIRPDPFFDRPSLENYYRYGTEILTQS